MLEFEDGEVQLDGRFCSACLQVIVEEVESFVFKWGVNTFSLRALLGCLHGKPPEYFFAKTAIGVKDGVPTQARGYTGGTARPSPGVHT